MEQVVILLGLLKTEKNKKLCYFVTKFQLLNELNLSFKESVFGKIGEEVKTWIK